MKDLLNPQPRARHYGDDSDRWGKGGKLLPSEVFWGLGSLEKKHEICKWQSECNLDKGINVGQQGWGKHLRLVYEEESPEG